MSEAWYSNVAPLMLIAAAEAALLLLCCCLAAALLLLCCCLAAALLLLLPCCCCLAAACLCPCCLCPCCLCPCRLCRYQPTCVREHFEATCTKAEVVIERGIRGFGIELAANYVVAVSEDSSARGKLRVHDVIVALGTSIKPLTPPTELAAVARLLRLLMPRVRPPPISQTGSCSTTAPSAKRSSQGRRQRR